MTLKIFSYLFIFLFEKPTSPRVTSGIMLICPGPPQCPYVKIFGWLVGMLLVSRSGLVEEDAVEVFHYCDFHLTASFLVYNFKSFQGK